MAVTVDMKEGREEGVMDCTSSEGAVSAEGLRTSDAKCERDVSDMEAKDMSLNEDGDQDERLESDDECPVSEAEDDDLVDCFKFIDENKDGFISAEELQILLRRFGHPGWESLKRCQELIGKVDRNNDGKCDLEEFLVMMRAPPVSRNSLPPKAERKELKSRNAVLRGILSFWKFRVGPKHRILEQEV